MARTKKSALLTADPSKPPRQLRTTAAPRRTAAAGSPFSSGEEEKMEEGEEEQERELEEEEEEPEVKGKGKRGRPSKAAAAAAAKVAKVQAEEDEEAEEVKPKAMRGRASKAREAVVEMPRSRPTKTKDAATSSRPAINASPNAQAFLKAAHELPATISKTGGEGELKLDAAPKVFATGSYGWTASRNSKVAVGGEMLDVSVSLNITVLRSAPHKSNLLAGAEQDSAEQAASSSGSRGRKR